MRAVRFHEYGPPDVLQVDEVPDPEPGPGEIPVRVTAAGIGFADIQIRAGLMRSVLADLPLPYSPGFEVAGTVIAVGPDVDPVQIGRQVVGATAGGGYAEKAVLPAVALSRPGTLDDHTTLALLGQGTTAVGVAEAAALRPGETVLVEAAAGGVGSLLVQLAKHAGTRVIAVARGEQKLDVAKRLGADAAIDYSTPDWRERVREAAGATLPLAQAATAHKAFEERTTIGKTVLTP
ncbi:zinc-binding dehydrogenase [Streptosporangium sp. NBC_01755]|uniref:quinone oxidoreductase family protein n=1 Tax=unclassified Streptosporangium TaxID=2632669 RepID=UPI002DDBAF03|nr:MULTISPECIES: zinc-binding dehydrogenase [unclassified Streptosporangium]WSA28653.1 zinc-binding dehydrogenase [Streptosporangium sp. NBC_01810]WSC99895.1 zinc-binding dehydrogenase [Streptosporangium sp. NBC_01755]